MALPKKHSNFNALLLPKDREPRIYFLTIIGFLIWYSFSPADYKVWFMEVLPVLLAFGLLRRLRFFATPLLYRSLFIQGLIIILAAHYTYKKVPLGALFQNLFGLSSNPFDRISFVMHGVVSALFTREMFKRCHFQKSGCWLPLVAFVLSICSSWYYKKVESYVPVLRLDEEAESDFMPSETAYVDHMDLQLTLFACSCALLFLANLHNCQWKILERKILETALSDFLTKLFTELAINRFSVDSAFFKNAGTNICPHFIMEHLRKRAQQNGSGYSFDSDTLTGQNWNFGDTCDSFDKADGQTPNPFSTSRNAKHQKERKRRGKAR